METIYNHIAYWLPRKVLYFAVIRAWAIATTEKYTGRTPDSLTWSEVIDAL